MSTYRILYAEREFKGLEGGNLLERIYGSAGGGFESSEVTETDWEETYDGRDASTALAAFFRDHTEGKDAVRILEEHGGARSVEENEEWDPDRTYVWVEEGKLMEYQGLDEATPGMVSCPLCDGAGEVAEAIAQDYEASQGSD
jgi:hypothetical protein